MNFELNKIEFKLIFICLVLSACGSSTAVSSAESDSDKGSKKPGYYAPAQNDYTTHIDDEKVKTLLIHRADSELEYPVINLNGNKRIELQFDDLSENVRDMYYRFEHCTSDWKPSDLRRMDYQTGYNSAIISDYQFSFNTIVPYTHYRVQFPNSDIQLTQSGNYVVRVYADDDTERPVLTARFMVVEPLASISADIKPSRVVADRHYRQEVDVTVNLGGLGSTNVYSDISLVVLQNNRWDNAKRNVKPSFVKGNQLVYNYQKELTFDGINEFRHVDAKSVRYRSEEVADVKLENNGYNIYLAPDIRRAFKQYTYEEDLNGRFLIKNDDMQNAALESDYIWIHFEMPVDALLGNGDMYLFGQLSHYRLAKPYRLEYNPEKLSYETTLQLKQGYYNYLYLWRYKNQDQGSTDLTEGNHSETENKYTILVYYSDPSAFSDRLVGYQVVNSVKK